MTFSERSISSSWKAGVPKLALAAQSILLQTNRRKFTARPRVAVESNLRALWIGGTEKEQSAVLLNEKKERNERGSDERLQTELQSEW